MIYFTLNGYFLKQLEKSTFYLNATKRVFLFIPKNIVEIFSCVIVLNPILFWKHLYALRRHLSYLLSATCFLTKMGSAQPAKRTEHVSKQWAQQSFISLIFQDANNSKHKFTLM